MVYERQLENTYTHLLTHPSPRHPHTSREAFNNVARAFMQADSGPGQQGVADEVKVWRAERNIWGYWFGDAELFPGIEPYSTTAPISSLHPSQTSSEIKSEPGRGASTAKQDPFNRDTTTETFIQKCIRERKERRDARRAMDPSWIERKEKKERAKESGRVRDETNPNFGSWEVIGKERGGADGSGGEMDGERPSNHAERRKLMRERRAGAGGWEEMKSAQRRGRSTSPQGENRGRYGREMDGGYRDRKDLFPERDDYGLREGRAGRWERQDEPSRLSGWEPENREGYEVRRPHSVNHTPLGRDTYRTASHAGYDPRARASQQRRPEWKERNPRREQSSSRNYQPPYSQTYHVTQDVDYGNPRASKQRRDWVEYDRGRQQSSSQTYQPSSTQTYQPPSPQTQQQLDYEEHKREPAKGEKNSRLWSETGTAMDEARFSDFTYIDDNEDQRFYSNDRDMIEFRENRDRVGERLTTGPDSIVEHKWKRERELEREEVARERRVVDHGVERHLQYRGNKKGWIDPPRGETFRK